MTLRKCDSARLQQSRERYKVELDGLTRSDNFRQVKKGDSLAVIDLLTDYDKHRVLCTAGKENLY